MKMNVDELILGALREDISSEDVSTNAVMKTAVPGQAELICFCRRRKCPEECLC